MASQKREIGIRVALGAQPAGGLLTGFAALAGFAPSLRARIVPMVAMRADRRQMRVAALCIAYWHSKAYGITT